MRNYSAILLRCSRQKSGYVLQSNNWYVKCIAETHKASRFARCFYVECTGIFRWLIGHNANRTSVKASKTHYDIWSIIAMYLQICAIIYDMADNLLYIVWFVNVFWNYGVEFIVHSINRIC